MPIGWDAGDFGGGAARPGVRPDELGAISRPLEPANATSWTRWETAEDERVCPECGPLDGRAWPEDEGPKPPLHNGCRCERRFAFVEWGSRSG